MDLDRYLRALAHYWYVVASLVFVGLLGTWIYVRSNRAQVAEASVAVLEPVTSQTGSGEQALVSFGSVVESRTLSERVVDKLGLSMTAEQLQGSISVKLSRTLVSSGSSPLYTVQVKNA